jgi:AraC-like DNA-binding protein
MEAWSNTLIHVNPFEEHLLSWPDRALPAVALEVPLPLSCWRTLEVQAESQGRAFHQELNALQVVADAGSAITVGLPGRDGVSLLFVAEGEVHLQQHTRAVVAAAGEWFLVPPQPLHWQSTNFNALCLTAPQQELQGMGPLLLQRLHPAQGSLQASLLEMLTVSLRTVAALPAGQGAVLNSLALDQHLLRLMGVLALSGGANEGVADPLLRPHASARDALDDLISYIKDNLDQPLNLTVLQNRSHYSRRALQYAFRERLGCTATQWIRAQRLDLARSRLLAAGPGDTVSSIAQACGYHAMGLFSIDFQQRFHVKPSVLLRESRGASAESDLG